MTFIYGLFAAIALSLLYLVFRIAAAVYTRYSGTRLIICPETRRPAAVELGAGYLAFSTLMLDPTMRLKSCTRWPERRNCGQECLEQIEAAPEDCLVRHILAHWYQGKSCVYCHKTFGPLRWTEHKPALLSPEGATVEWRDIRPELVPEVLLTHEPVCWNCHIAETFRREHAELVVDRDFHTTARWTSRPLG